LLPAVISKSFQLPFSCDCHHLWCHRFPFHSNKKIHHAVYIGMNWPQPHLPLFRSEFRNAPRKFCFFMGFFLKSRLVRGSPSAYKTLLREPMNLSFSLDLYARQKRITSERRAEAFPRKRSRPRERMRLRLSLASRKRASEATRKVPLEMHSVLLGLGDNLRQCWPFCACRKNILNRRPIGQLFSLPAPVGGC
jgi:hypothetical protein